MYMHLFRMGKMSQDAETARNNLPVLPCLCANLRRATRAITQRYERATLPVKLSASQMTILQVLARTGELTQGQLAEMLAMDSTSLTRTLSIMTREGWLALRRGKDRRERWIRLSRSGKQKLREAEPLWRRAQSERRDALGAQDWNQLMQLAYRAAATKKGEKQ